MKENSREEDIKILEEMIENANIENMDMNNCFGGEHIEAIEHILSDYKRVLKENELLRKDIEGWKKYCEEIEEEQTEISNKNCKLEFEIEKLQKENEELKLKERRRIIGKYGEFEIHDVINRTLSNDYIPVQKVKDKIKKEIKYHEKNILDIENMTMLKGKTAKEEAEIEFNKYAIVVLKKMLQELLEGRK